MTLKTVVNMFRPFGVIYRSNLRFSKETFIHVSTLLRVKSSDIANRLIDNSEPRKL